MQAFKFNFRTFAIHFMALLVLFRLHFEFYCDTNSKMSPVYMNEIK